MWAALGRHIRRVGLVLWVVLLVAFGPSQSWAAGDDSASATSEPAPTSPSGSESSSPPPSSETGSEDNSSSTAGPEPSSEDSSEVVVVQLEPEQWQTVHDLMSTRETTPPPAAMTSGAVTLDPEQWDQVTEWATAFGIGFAVLVLVGSAGTIAAWGRNS